MKIENVDSIFNPLKITSCQFLYGSYEYLLIMRLVVFIFSITHDCIKYDSHYYQISQLK